MSSSSTSPSRTVCAASRATASARRSPLEPPLVTLPPDSTYDPLAARREPDGPEFDVFLWGTVFLDIVFTGLESMPANGTEVWADGMGSCPGGIANLAI